MSDLQRCPECGAACSQASLVSGLCPVCLMKLGLGRVRVEYQILTVLGAGPSGTLYLAAREGAQRKLVTVRHLAAGLAAGVQPSRFENVLERLVGLDHANLVPVLDGGIVDGGPVYVVSEYVAGVSLSTFCERQRPGLGQRIALLVSVCRATEHAHRNGITHGHLAAPDVLVSPASGVPASLVRDFGIRMLAGADPDPVRDLLALGALLGDLVAPCTSLPGTLADVVRRASGPASGGSYTSAEQLAADLERCTSEASTTLL
jgi:serine/threonine protein kinase